MYVKDIMTKDVHTVTPDTTAEDAANLMVKHNIGGLPVLERDGKIVGIITESDFLGKRVDVPRAITSLHELLGQWVHHTSLEEILDHAKGLPVADVMSTDLRLVHPDTSLTALVKKMVDGDLNRVLVCDQNKLVGIVARRDIMRAFSKLN